MVDMDRKLVASEEQYELAYFAQKHGISAAEAREILDRAGRSREKADALAETHRRLKAVEHP
jgi:hypothetical protein